MSTRSFPLLAAGCALLFLLLVPAFGQGVGAASDLKVTGYVQARVGAGDEWDSEFWTQDAFIRLEANTGKNTGFGLLYGTSPADGVLEAFGKYVDKKTTYRLGLYRTPFGYEANESGANLITMDRSMIIDDYVYWPWAYDRGIFVDHEMGKGTTLKLALTNGEDMDDGLPDGPYDEDNQKNLTVRYGKKTDKCTWGVSGMFGNWDQDGKFTTLGVDYMTKKKDLTIVAEALWHRWDPDEYWDDARGSESAEAQGFYVTLAQQKAGSSLQKYIRFDAERDEWDDDYAQLTVGVSKTFNPLAKLSLEATLGDYDADKETWFQAQWQASF